MDDESCEKLFPRIPPAGAKEMALRYGCSNEFGQEPNGRDFFMHAYEHHLRLQGWEPVEGTAHVHVGPYPVDTFEKPIADLLVTVHGLGIRIGVRKDEE